MRILVCGSRNWTDFTAIYSVLRDYQHTAEVVIHGAARGADTLAGQAAEALDIPIEAYEANWDKFGHRAGPIRNSLMLRDGKPDLVLAFHNDIQNSKGTKDMVLKSTKEGIRTIVIDEYGNRQEQSTLF